MYCLSNAWQGIYGNRCILHLILCIDSKYPFKFIITFFCRTVHNQCQSQMGEVCDFGEFQHFIVRPQLVRTKPNRTMRYPKQRVIDEVQIDQNLVDKKWHPLIVIGNKKSGNKDCISILATFRGQLNPSQVVDLDESKMEDGLKWCQLLDCYDDIKPYILVAGGDGTIG